jgi:hypothetical protein
MMQKVSPDLVTGIYRTFAFDRLQSAIKTSGDVIIPYGPTSYYSLRDNLMPQSPRFNRNGELIYENKKQKTGRIPSKQGVTIDQQAAVQAQEGVAQPQGQGQEGQVRLMPKGEPNTARLIDDDKFYSQLERVISDKVPTRATKQQIMATIDPTRGSGVKADEIKWSGIEQELASLEKDGKVSKDDLLNYLRNDGRAKFEEVIQSDVPNAENPMLVAKAERLASEAYNSHQRYLTEYRAVIKAGKIKDADAKSKLDEMEWEYATKRVQAEKARSEAFDSSKPTRPTKFSQYVLPGGENYREVVLAMPHTTKAQYVIAYKDGSGQLGGLTFDTEAKAKAEMADMFKGRNDLEVQPFYREKAVSEYTSSHFPDIPNYVAHMRTNERTLDNGSKGLFVEEFQSDRHQEGRKKGYAIATGTTPTQSQAKEFFGIADETWNAMPDDQRQAYIDEIIEGGEHLKGGVADAPFRTTWPLQLFKRALRDAVDGGKDWIGWTTGETQNERFDLSKSLDSIEVRRIDGSNRVTVYGTRGNNNVITQQSTLEALPDVIGKELAEKVISDMSPKGTPQQIQRAKIAAEEARKKLQQPGVGYDSPLFDEYERKAEEFRVLNGKSDVSYSGLDLKVGGEGMKGFYDNMLPKEVGKYVKQWGGKVEKAEIDIREPASEAWYKEPTDDDYKPIWKVNITPEMRKISQTGQMRFMPEMPSVPQDTGFRSITDQGAEFIGKNYKGIAPGAILGTVRFMPEAENDRILTNFPLGEDEKKKMEGKAGFAFVSDWSDSNRPYITKNGREIDVLMGGVGYTYHPEVIGKGGWAGSFSALTNRVLDKINQTDGIGLVVAGARDSTASSRSFSIAALEELKDDIANKTVSKAVINNIIKNNAERLLGIKNIKSLDDYEKLIMLKRDGGGLTFEQRADMIKAINSHENKKSFGISNWNDVLKKYEMQNGVFVPGQIMSVVQFKKNAPLVRASDLNVKGHKSYEAVIQGKPLGVLKGKVMIADFFKDFFASEGTLPANYTRKVQTKMPSFKYGEGSAVLKETAKSIANAAKLK